MGIDASPAFVARARRDHPDLEFVEQDLTVGDVPAADLVFARYLLSHLADPEHLVERWRSTLRPGGRLLVEENTRLRIDHPVFRRYEDAVAVVMGSGGGDLYVGERLVGSADHVTGASVSPTAGVIARLFGMNLATWGRRADAADLDVEALAADLRSLEVSEERGLVVFDLAQLTFEAASSA